jgi:HicB family
MDERDERVKFMAKLPPELHHRLKVAAAERSVNMNDLICESVEAWLGMREMGKAIGPLLSGKKTR